MDSKRLISFIVLSLGVLLLWQHFFPPKPAPAPVAQTQDVNSAKGAAAKPADASRLAFGQRINVSTDLVRAQIDTVGGDLRTLDLVKHGSSTDEKKPYELMTDKGGRVYVAQTGLVDPTRPDLPTHKTVFSAEKSSYVMSGDKLEVRLTAPEADGVKVAKIYEFTKGSYLIRVRYEITNAGTVPLAPTAYFRLLRDGKEPEGQTRFANTFTGPAVYSAEHKFQKVSFSDLDKNKADYAQTTQNGWVSMLQHYFLSAWVLKPLDGKSVCRDAASCHFELKAANGLYSASATVALGAIAPGATASIAMPLYAGPEDYDTLTRVAEGLELSRDYGWVHVIAAPLFWLLVKLHALVQNWGWAIVLLTIIIKGAFYPLTAASYRSMAKMKALAPRLERLKEQHGDDRMKFQQAVMEMYKVEKVNPLGGCLPILIQIPVFFALYSALLAAVELREAPWVMWIHDLARPDPFYVLPALMAITMFIQTMLNPPPTDPVQAKMAKIMPVAFSVMFFFFPAGLVLYYVVNNLLSIAQQWFVNRQIENAKKAAAQS
ncbi:membrane protein insertase YidC [Paludibacterium paludis]|uniref:Membrane protein insertase YidC n=1 Tax=Paludibacterium paludis TaxID=1225769 RepID=A0A918NZ91_9NEIS|nr:membrane protein insertase YidC [Paludibacterium paludis]GGY08914.1 membrane protein insertase YidC [Paludibacterium paludis]